LRELGARGGEVLEQVDRYFNHPARDFAKTDEALRLRRVGAANFITYKGPKLDPTTKTRREIELPLPPGAAEAEGFSELLVALGFRPVSEVRKTRRLLHVDFQGHPVEVALDNVAGLGAFIELELSADENKMAAAKACIAALTAALGLHDSERRSYLELLLIHSPTVSGREAESEHGRTSRQ
jgi:adenylate cyclase, class 2